jgi:hypothetical protein
MAWEVFTLVIRGASGAFLGDCFGFLFKGSNPLSQRISTDHPNILKKGQVDQGKEGPSLHLHAPGLQISPFAFLRTKAKGSSIVQHSG